MKEKRVIQFFVLIFWTFFWGLSVVDKIIPDVHLFWVGKDFFALFIKFFSSLGLKDPMFATVALATISALEVINFALYLIALINFGKAKEGLTQKWFFRAIFSSVILFSLFSIADQVFGDRFQLLEHGLFWFILIASWIIFKYFVQSEENIVSFKKANGIRLALIIGTVLTVFTSILIFNFSSKTFYTVDAAVLSKEVVPGVYKFDFPFLADKLVWEKTINTFKEQHPQLKINYIYTGPSELNSKKKTHMLLYVFTEELK